MNENYNEINRLIVRLQEVLADNEEGLNLLDQTKKAIEDISGHLHIQNARVIHAERLASLADMATGVSHELNQPFNVILMAAQMVRMWIKKKKEMDFDRLDRLMRDIETGVHRGSKIITHMRQFGSGSSYQTLPLDLNRPIREIFDLLSQQLKAEDVKVTFELDEDLPPIKADNYQIQQIFFQLISNARDALHDKAVAMNEENYEKKLIVKTGSDDDYNVTASIIDNGSGILENNLKKIFDPFFSTKEVNKGKGLGLAIIYGLVKEYNGTVEAESELGVGTKFTLKFLPA